MAIPELSAQIDVRSLERQSSSVYSVVAAEYYDARHMTCRAFDFLDEQILDHYQDSRGLVGRGRLYLEVGAGRAALLRRVLLPDSMLIAGDLCPQMAEHALPLPANITYRQFSAFNLPFSEGHFDGVFAFLADSYNVPRFYEEAWRVLSPSGFLLMTCPTRLWAETLRQGESELLFCARFPTHDGRTTLIPSITWSEGEYRRLLADTGFTKVLYEDFCLPSDYPSNHIPDTIQVPAQRLGIEISCLPLVGALLAHKEGR